MSSLIQFNFVSFQIRIQVHFSFIWNQNSNPISSHFKSEFKFSYLSSQIRIQILFPFTTNQNSSLISSHFKSELKSHFLWFQIRIQIPSPLISNKTSSSPLVQPPPHYQGYFIPRLFLETVVSGILQASTDNFEFSIRFPIDSTHRRVGIRRASVNNPPQKNTWVRRWIRDPQDPAVTRPLFLVQPATASIKFGSTLFAIFPPQNRKRTNMMTGNPCKSRGVLNRKPQLIETLNWIGLLLVSDLNRWMADTRGCLIIYVPGRPTCAGNDVINVHEDHPNMYNWNIQGNESWTRVNKFLDKALFSAARF